MKIHIRRNLPSIPTGYPIRCLCLLGFALYGASHLNADPEQTNYKTGIDVTFSGTKGVAYMEEYFYHDKVVSDRKVIYIRDDTDITMSHNSRNVAAINESSYETIGTSGGGTIRYKFDRDINLNWSPTGNNAPAYSGSFALEDIEYETGIALVGSTGPKPGISLNTTTQTSTYYWRGVLDSVGDEWHVLTIWDDDANIAQAADPEWRGSDGKVHLFVVNPKTPAMTVRATGDGQFYTTPPKSYFIPVIHDQITYIDPGSGSVTFEIRDLYGNDVHYRINGGSFTDAGASSVTLDDGDFSNGTNTLEYYYEGNESYVKTRTVIKNPGYPSASEDHGDRFWNNEWSEVTSRIAADSLLDAWMENWEDGSWSGHGSIENYLQGERNANTNAAPNAIAARENGMTASRSGAPYTYAQYSRRALFAGYPNSIDPVGFELQHLSTGLPSREIIYRGYYDVNHVLSAALAYDVLIGYYRENQGYSDGITAIEDYFLRDQLAAYNMTAVLLSGGYKVGLGFDASGMWEVCRKLTGMVLAITMPGYDTPYLGTSGLDGSTSSITDNPFPDVSYTWKSLWFDNNLPLNGFPNVDNRLGMEEYLFNANGDWLDKVGYWDMALCGHVMQWTSLMCKMWYPSLTFPRLEQSMLNAVNGTLIHTQGVSRKNPMICVNSLFPDIYDDGYSWVESLASSDGNSKNKIAVKAPVWCVLGYNSDFTPGGGGGGDNTYPSVSITAPSNSSTVSGSSVTVSASASDNVGVVGIQFKLDGANLGAEDMTSPYSITWDTTTTGNGGHALTALARDAAGNSTLSSTVNVTVSNTTDTTAPSVPLNLTASNITAFAVDLDWDASTDNSGTVEGYKIYTGGSNPVSTPSTAVTLVGLSPETSYIFTVSAYDPSGNESSQSSGVNVTTSTAINPQVVAVQASSDDGNIPENTLDDDLGTRWSALGDGEWIEYQFDDQYLLQSVDLAFFKGNERVATFDLEVSHDGSNWTVVLDDATSSGTTNALENFDFTDTDTTFVRYVGYGNSSNDWNSLTEVRFNLTSSADTTAPSTPTGLSSPSKTTTSVDLSWSASTDNVGVTGYRIYTNGANPVLISSGLNGTISGLTENTSYTFTLTAMDAAGNESSPSSGLQVTTNSSGSSGNFSALMLDFGPTSPSGQELNSPGHQVLGLSSTNSHWNVVGTSAPSAGTLSGLNYADGTSASGVTMTYGATTQGSKVIDFTASIASSNALGTVANTGVYTAGSVARDGIWNGGSSGSDLSIGIRVDGLAAGNHTVLIMARNTNTGTSSSAMKVYATAGSTSSSYDFSSASATSLSNSSTSWSSGDTYGSIAVTLSSGQSLYIVADGDVSTGDRGFLNAVQIITNGPASDTEAPGTPTGLASGSITTNSVALSWNASSDNVGVTGYMVYTGGSNPIFATGTSTTITGLTQNTAYSFTVSAVDAASNESSQSSSVNVTTADGQAPSIPTGLAAGTITTSSIDLSWNASSDNVGVTGYKIYTDGSNPVSVSGTSTTITGLDSDTEYTFTVSAVDAAANESSPSSEVNVSTAAEAIGLMIDFGATSPSGSMLTNSPGHDTSDIDSGDDNWNVVATSSGNSGTVSSLVYASGSTATGVSFTYGASPSGSKVIDYTASIASSSALGSVANSDIYASGSVARDGIWNGGSSGSDLSVGIRIDGLAAGNYTVYVMARNTNSSSNNGMDVYAITGSSSSSYHFGSDTPTNITNTNTTSWSEDNNYAAISVTISTSQSLYVITDGSDTGGQRGFLNAVQIVSQ